MDALTLFGFAGVAAMLLFYWLEQRDPRYVLAFALARFQATSPEDCGRTRRGQRRNVPAPPSAGYDQRPRKWRGVSS